MPRMLRVLRSRLPQGVALWAGLTIVAAVLALVGVMAFLPAPKAEIANAIAASQHVSVDAKTGAMTGLGKKTEADAEAHPATPALANTAPAATPNAAATIPNAPPPSASVSAATPADAPRLATEPPVAAAPAVTSNSESLVPPPAKEITEHTTDFTLPKRGDNDESAATLYARNYTAKKDIKSVSIVITDAGLNPQVLALIEKMPHGVTVAVSPYAPDAAAVVAQLHQAGFETWSMLPTMGTNYPQTDPGPLGLISSLPPEENTRRLHQIMSNTIGAAGMVLPADETIDGHVKTFEPLLKEINKRGLLLLSTRMDIGLETLLGKGSELIPLTRRAQVLLDASAPATEIQSKLDGLQLMLANRTSLILVVPAQPQLLSVVLDWLNHNGLGPSVDIAPLSAQYKTAAAPTAPATDAGKDAAKPADSKPADAKPASGQDAKPAASKPQ